MLKNFFKKRSMGGRLGYNVAILYLPCGRGPRPVHTCQNSRHWTGSCVNADWSFNLGRETSRNQKQVKKHRLELLKNQYTLMTGLKQLSDRLSKCRVNTTGWGCAHGLNFCKLVLEESVVNLWKICWKTLLPTYLIVKRSNALALGSGLEQGFLTFYSVLSWEF